MLAHVLLATALIAAMMLLRLLTSGGRERPGCCGAADCTHKPDEPINTNGSNRSADHAP